MFYESGASLAFICVSGLYEQTRVPFGVEGTGCTFPRAVNHCVEPIKQFIKAYLDDNLVYSKVEHPSQGYKHVSSLYQSIRVTLNFGKCRFAKSENK